MTASENSNSKLTIFAILVILLVFPLLSWYYLKQGFNYQKASRSELANYGQLPPFRFTNLKGQEYNLDSLDEKMAVLGFIGSNDEQNKTMFEMTNKLHEQFGQNNTMQFLLIPLLKEKASVAYLSSIAEQYQLADPEQHHLLSGIENAIRNWVGSGVKIPADKITKEGEVPRWNLKEDYSGEIQDYPYFVLVDTSHTIRNYYNFTNYAEVKRMVEHIAIILPQPKRPDAILRRETEK